MIELDGLMTDYEGNPLPSDAKIEKELLNCLLGYKGIYQRYEDLVFEEMFFDSRNRVIYNAIKMMFIDGSALSLATLLAQLKKTGNLAKVTGADNPNMAYLIDEIIPMFVIPETVETLIRVLHQHYLRRHYYRTSIDAMRKSIDLESDVFDIIEVIQSEQSKANQVFTIKREEGVAEVVAKAIKRIELASASTEEINGIPTGFMDLDRITGGWQKTDLIVIASRPSMGKTALMVSMMRNASVDFTKCVAVFSLEMSTDQLALRLISGETDINNKRLKSGDLEAKDWEDLNTKITRLVNSKMFFDDTPKIELGELRAKARRMKIKHDIQALFIDYLQLVDGKRALPKGGYTREREVSEISSTLKKIAKELDIPVIVFSQLSREVEKRSNKRPMLSDLRESGSIEQDADIVAFIHRPEYYEKQAGKSESDYADDVKGYTEIIVSKHRNGELGEVSLIFDETTTKFRKPDDDYKVPDLDQKKASSGDPDTEDLPF